jgi:rSAM/selenodomain-associated transferase 1
VGGSVLVFMKYPEPGRVKTRMAASCGAGLAAALYREWIGAVLGRLQPIRGPSRVIGFIDGAPAERFAAWAPLVDEWLPQPPGDLGDRLAAGFEAAHGRGGPAVALGTDCLEVDAGLIDEALARLEDRDAVFGPAADGGYYLVGTARHLPGFFEGIRWSTPRALADHLARCRDRGWSVAMLGELRDIDTWDDWREYLARRAAGRGDAGRA